jgi:uncharacterized membrane protein
MRRKVLRWAVGVLATIGLAIFVLALYALVWPIASEWVT